MIAISGHLVVLWAFSEVLKKKFLKDKNTKLLRFSTLTVWSIMVVGWKVKKKESWHCFGRGGKTRESLRMTLMRVIKSHKCEQLWMLNAFWVGKVQPYKGTQRRELFPCSKWLILYFAFFFNNKMKEVLHPTMKMPLHQWKTCKSYIAMPICQIDVFLESHAINLSLSHADIGVFSLERKFPSKCFHLITIDLWYGNCLNVE